MYLNAAISSLVRVVLTVNAGQRRARGLLTRAAVMKREGAKRGEVVDVGAGHKMQGAGRQSMWLTMKPQTETCDGFGMLCCAAALCCCRMSGTHLGIPNAAARETWWSWETNGGRFA
jgi:hypothetical protein